MKIIPKCRIKIRTLLQASFESSYSRLLWYDNFPNFPFVNLKLFPRGKVVLISENIRCKWNKLTLMWDNNKTIDLNLCKYNNKQQKKKFFLFNNVNLTKTPFILPNNDVIIYGFEMKLDLNTLGTIWHVNFTCLW